MKVARKKAGDLKIHRVFRVLGGGRIRGGSPFKVVIRGNRIILKKGRYDDGPRAC